MKKAWFSVLCEVDNGCTLELWQSIVRAYTLSEAKRIAKHDWQSKDSETVASVLSCHILPEDEIVKMKVRNIV